MQLVRSEVMALSRTNATTRMEVAQLEAPARIQKIAETKLGMKVATNAIYGGRDNRTAKVNIRD